MSFIKEHKKEIIISATSLVVVVASFYLLKKFVFSHEARLKRIAKADLRKWKDKKETNPKVSKYLVDYWEKTGKNFTEAQMQNASTQSSYPWSSAYIGHLVDKAGFKNFQPSTSHSAYVVEARKNRSDKQKRSYWAYKPSDGLKVEIGDILVKGRSGTKPNLDTLNSGVKTHGDIVVDFAKIDGKRFAITQGGNVSDTVKQTRVPLTDDKKLLNPVHFAQLKYVR